MAVKKIEALDGQSISDFAVQVYGEGVRGVFKLIQDNPEMNLTTTTTFTSGQTLKVLQAPSNKAVADYFESNDLHPVGTIENMPGDGGFSWSAFSSGFNV